MIINILGDKLTPGNCGKYCKWNGNTTDENGKLFECCCDECDYLMCCIDEHNPDDCLNCTNEYCPNVKNKKNL